MNTTGSRKENLEVSSKGMLYLNLVIKRIPADTSAESPHPENKEKIAKMLNHARANRIMISDFIHTRF